MSDENRPEPTAGGRGFVPGFLTEGTAPAPRPRRRRSPFLAWFLSLFLPGLGHFYCGKWKRGFWTLVLFLLGCFEAAAFLGSSDPQVQRVAEVGVLLALGMYVFGFLDAYFTAGEINEGADEFLVTNPRVAAILNFLTNGLGYFYVGQRRKGIILFVSLTVANLILGNVTVTALAPLLVVVFGLLRIWMAVDAYRIAVREGVDVRTVLPEQTPQRAGGLPPVIPLTLAFVFVAGYLGLALLGGVFQSVGLTDEEIAAESANPSATAPAPSAGSRIVVPDRRSPVPRAVPELVVADSKTWVNPSLGLKMALPAAWHQLPGGQKYAMAATSPAGDCLVTVSVGPSTGLPLLADHMAGASADFLSRNVNARIRQRGPDTLANLPAEEVVYDVARSQGSMVETHVLAVAGKFVYAFRGVGPAGHVCETESAWIRNHVEITGPSD